MSITVSKDEVIGFEKLKAISQIAPIEKQKRLHQTFLQAKTFTKKMLSLLFCKQKPLLKMLTLFLNEILGSNINSN